MIVFCCNNLVAAQNGRCATDNSTTHSFGSGNVENPPALANLAPLATVFRVSSQQVLAVWVFLGLAAFFLALQYADFER